MNSWLETFCIPYHSVKWHELSLLAEFPNKEETFTIGINLIFMDFINVYHSQTDKTLWKIHQLSP